jgi:MFS family permease
MFIDMLGGGLLSPFELLYGNRVAGLSFAEAGGLMAIAAVLAIAIGPIAGAAVDRRGPVQIVAGASVVGLMGCVVLFIWTEAPGFFFGIFLLSASLRIFYGAFTPFVAAVAEPEELDQWFGRLRAARFVGLGTGQALSGVVLLGDIEHGLRLVVVANGLSFIGALVLLLLAGAGLERPRAHAAEASSSGTYRLVLRDRPNLAIAALNVLATLLILTPVVALPVFVIEQLDQATWAAGGVSAVTTATVVLGLLVAPRLLRRRGRLRNLALACTVWLLAFLLLFVSSLAAGVAVIAVLLGAVMLGMGEAVYVPSADTLPAVLAPPELQGRYAALHQMGWGVSETVAPALSGLFLASAPEDLWLVLAGLSALGAIAYLSLAKRIGGRDGIVGAALPRQERAASYAVGPT